MDKSKDELSLIYQLKGDLSLRAFQRYLNQNLPKDSPGNTTWMSIWNWVNRRYPITMACIMAWMAYYPPGDSRHETAKDLLAIRSRSSDYTAEDAQKLLKALQR